MVEHVIPVQLQWWFDEVLDQLDKAFLESSMEALKESRVSCSDEDEVRLNIERDTERRRNRYVQSVGVAIAEIALSLLFSTTVFYNISVLSVGMCIEMFVTGA